MAKWNPKKPPPETAAGVKNRGKKLVSKKDRKPRTKKK